MAKVRLGDVAIERKETSKNNQSLPTVGLEHLIPGEVTLTQWEENSNNTFTKVFRKGDVLFGRRRAYLKKAAVAKMDGICSGDITVIAAKPEKIKPDLLPFIIQNDDFFVFAVEKSAGSLSPRAKWQYLKDYEFNLPDLDEQERLSEILWAIQDTKHAYQRLLKRTDELVKSQFIVEFQHIDKDDYRDLKEVCTLITDGTHNPPKFVDEGIPFLLVSNITDDVVTYETTKYITEETYDELMKRTPIEIGDVLLSTVGSYGHPAVVIDDRKFAFQRHIAHLKPNRSLIDSRYLHTAILSTDVQEQIDTLVLGVAQKTLNLSAIKKIRIPLPTMDEQTGFVRFVEQSDKSKFELENAIKELTATYKRIVADSFS